MVTPSWGGGMVVVGKPGEGARGVELCHASQRLQDCLTVADLPTPTAVGLLHLETRGAQKYKASIRNKPSFFPHSHNPCPCSL